MEPFIIAIPHGYGRVAYYNQQARVYFSIHVQSLLALGKIKDWHDFQWEFWTKAHADDFVVWAKQFLSYMTYGKFVVKTQIKKDANFTLTFSWKQTKEKTCEKKYEKR